MNKICLSIIKLAAAFAAAALASAAAAQTVTLKYSAWLPATHWMNAIAIDSWTKEVNKATQGRVKIDFLPKGVGAPNAQYDACRDGLVDVCLFVASYQPGRFRLAEIAELPLLGSDPATMAPVYYRVYQASLAKYGEFADVQLMTLFPASAAQTFTTKTPIKSLADFSGLKMKTASGTATRAAELLGAVPILKPATEAYELLSSGIVDGEFSPFESIKGTNTIQLLKHATIVDGGLANYSLGLIINKSKWNSIAEKDREAIMAVSGEALARKIGQGYVTQNTEALAIMKARNYTFETIKGAEFEKFKKALAPLDAKWFADVKAKGVPDPERILADFRAQIKAEEAKK